MASSQSYLVFAALVFLGLVHFGFSLQCFMCVEPKGDVCRNDKGLGNAKMNCPEPNVCITHKISGCSVGDLAPTEVVVRLCGSRNYCSGTAKRFENVVKASKSECTECTTNYCN